MPKRTESGGDGSERKYDLEERTAVFAEQVVQFAKRLPPGPVGAPLTNQLVRAGTSIGANYCEADDAVSRKEFRVKIVTCRKEAKETKYWLRVIGASFEDLRAEARRLWLEARELHLIFCAIVRKMDSRTDK